MMNNDYIYEGIKKSLVEDIIIAYEVFKEEQYPDLEGVILSLNSFGNFGTYLRENADKLADFTEHLYSNLDFSVQITFSKDYSDGFYPLFKK